MLLLQSVSMTVAAVKEMLAGLTGVAPPLLSVSVAELRRPPSQGLKRLLHLPAEVWHRRSHMRTSLLASLSYMVLPEALNRCAHNPPSTPRSSRLHLAIVLVALRFAVVNSMLPPDEHTFCKGGEGKMVGVLCVPEAVIVHVKWLALGIVLMIIILTCATLPSRPWMNAVRVQVHRMLCTEALMPCQHSFAIR